MDDEIKFIRLIFAMITEKTANKLCVTHLLHTFSTTSGGLERSKINITVAKKKVELFVSPFSPFFSTNRIQTNSWSITGWNYLQSELVNALCSFIHSRIIKIPKMTPWFLRLAKKDQWSFILSMRLKLIVIIHDWIELQWCANSRNEGFWIPFLTEKKWPILAYLKAKDIW